MAAAAWKLPVITAIRRLTHDGLLSELDARRHSNYLADYVNTRLRLRDCLTAAKKQVGAPKTFSGRAVLRRYAGETITDHLAERYGQIVGITDETSLEYAFGKKGILRSLKAAIHSDDKSSLEFLVAPFYDLPGHMCGMMVVAHKADEAVYIEVPSARRSKGIPGLLVFDGLRAPPMEMFGDTRFLLTDLDFLLRLQFAWLKESNILLPVAGLAPESAACYDMIPSSWGQMHLPELICCGEALTTHLVSCAMKTRSQVSVVRLSPETERAAIASPTLKLHTFRKRAIPWEAALRNLLAAAAPEEIEVIRDSLQMSSQELREFLASGYAATLPPSVCGARTTPLSRRTIRFAGYTISETADGWYTADGSVISTVIVRIDQIVVGRGGKQECRGKLLCRGKTIPFAYPRGKIEKRLLSVVHHAACRHGETGLVFDPKWDGRAFQLAQLFWPSAVVRGDISVGWDDELRQFNFPRFAITATGNVVDSPVRRRRRMPAQFDPPSDVLPQDISASLSDDAGLLFRAVFSCVAASVAAPALKHPVRGIILAGDPRTADGVAAARAAGCMVRFNRHVEYDTKHGWPSVVYRCSRRRRDAMPNIIIESTWEAARVEGTHEHWNIVFCDRPLGTLGDIPALAGRLIPAYFLNLCKRRLAFAWPTRSLAMNLLYDMAAWAERQWKGAEARMREAATLLAPAELVRADEHFGILLAHLAGTKPSRIRLIEGTDLRAGERSCILHLDHAADTLWIPQAPILEYMAKRTSVQPARPTITKALADAGALVREEPRELRRCAPQVAGWLVRRSWWNRMVESAKRRVI